MAGVGNNYLSYVACRLCPTDDAGAYFHGALFAAKKASLPGQIKFFTKIHIGADVIANQIEITIVSKDSHTSIEKKRPKRQGCGGLNQGRGPSPRMHFRCLDPTLLKQRQRVHELHVARDHCPNMPEDHLMQSYSSTMHSLCQTFGYRTAKRRPLWQ